MNPVEKAQLETLIAEWLRHALDCEQMKRDKFDSIHLDELAKDSWPESPLEQFDMSIRLYSELIEQYRDNANQIKATLVLVVGDSNIIDAGHSLADLSSGRQDFSRVPELYLQQRWSDLAPYVVEEYKRPVKQEVVEASEGVVYAYYRSHRNSPKETYEHGFYLEHYPQGDAKHEWA